MINKGIIKEVEKIDSHRNVNTSLTNNIGNTLNSVIMHIMVSVLHLLIWSTSIDDLVDFGRIRHQLWVCIPLGVYWITGGLGFVHVSPWKCCHENDRKYPFLRCEVVHFTVMQVEWSSFLIIFSFSTKSFVII